ncbi:DUF2690 domain-containing protein [Angustibacter luteus]|uniref:DUF2690 domain-containing protein n=1 Tax=Angustibacter luteus TaxID=658456 RepID=A0ABW1JH46_9ACTN
MLALTAATGLATSAQAANFPHDGNFAREDGCRADQQVIYHTVIYQGSTAVGYIDLMYSVHCHSAWGHVHGTRTVQNQTWVPHGYIHRNYDGKQYQCTTAEGAQDCYTPMVYDLNMTSYAKGIIDPNGAAGTEFTARTPSY